MLDIAIAISVIGTSVLGCALLFYFAAVLIVKGVDHLLKLAGVFPIFVDFMVYRTEFCRFMDKHHSDRAWLVGWQRKKWLNKQQRIR